MFEGAIVIKRLLCACYRISNPVCQSSGSETRNVQSGPMAPLIDVLVPVLHRPQSIPRFMRSLQVTAPLATAWFICEDGDVEEQVVAGQYGAQVLSDPNVHTFAQKVNFGYRNTAAPWMLLVGDDVIFRPNWLEEAMRVAELTWAQVISTNDLHNTFVMRGEDAVHPIISRHYVDQFGASWDGPGVVAHEGYKHHGPDTEIVDVAISRQVFAPSLKSIVEHLHPDNGKAPMDRGYQVAATAQPKDRELFFARRAQFLPEGRDLSKILHIPALVPPPIRPRHTTLKNSIACYTTIFGGYDNLWPHPDIPDVDFICFTDGRTPINDPTWDIRVDTRSAQVYTHPRMAAKWFRLHPHVCLPEYEYTLYIDGSHEIFSPKFIHECLAQIDESGIALHTHPERECIYGEVPFSLQRLPNKYAGLPLIEQAESYRAEGFPEHWGLWASGSIARRNTPAVARLMDFWWYENQKWTYQDQVSFPVVCWRLGIRPASFPWPQIIGSPGITYHEHNRND